MSRILSALFALFSHFTGPSLLVLGLLDSSFLFIPLGPDVLLIALSAHHHKMAPYYALMLSVGSVCGCALIDVICRAGGEKGLERFLSRRQIRSVEKRVRKRAGWALVLAPWMPPPFPFTAVVIAASAFQYPRKKLLTIVGFMRFGRYLTEGLFAIYFGRQLLTAAKSVLFEVGIILLVILSVAGSAFSAYKWLRKSHARSGKTV